METSDIFTIGLDEAPAPRRSVRQVTDAYSPHILGFVAKGGAYPIHAHDFYEVMYIFQGAGIVYLGGCAARVRSDDLVFVGRHTTHGFCLEPSSTALMIGVDPSDVKEFARWEREFQVYHLLVRGASRFGGLGFIFRQMLAQPERLQDGISLTGRLNLVLGCLSEIADDAQLRCPKRQPSRTDVLAEPLYQSITSGRRICVADLAKRAGITSTYLSKTFASLFGLSFPNYCALPLIDSARRQLVQSDRPIGEISQRCHYSSLRSFNRQFQALSGMTPTEYRRKYAPLQIVEYGVHSLEPELRDFYERLCEECPEVEAIDRIRTP